MGGVADTRRRRPQGRGGTMVELLRDYGLPTALLLAFLWAAGRGAFAVWRDLVLPLRDKGFAFLDGLITTLAGIRRSLGRLAREQRRQGAELTQLRHEAGVNA